MSKEVTFLKPEDAKFVEPTAEDHAALARAMAGEMRPYLPLALVEWTPQHVVLAPVSGKRGKGRYDPPQTHLDVPITDLSPVAIARLALAYLDQMIREADELT